MADEKMMPSNYCCFGVIDELEFILAKGYKEYIGPVKVTAGDPARLVEVHTDQVLGALSMRSQKILHALCRDVKVELYTERLASKTASTQNPNNAVQKPRRNQRVNNIRLSATLYGAEHLFDSVGIFVARCGFYLQHPEYCELNLPYRNPHCLTPTNGIRTTFDMIQSLGQNSRPLVEACQNPIDLFAETEGQNPLSETETPESLKSELFPHQKQGLTFLLQREKGWALHSDRRDVWKQELTSSSDCRYINTIFGTQHIKAPPSFRGGLLIDAPGLGKSLSILSLIAMDSYLPTDTEEDRLVKRNTLLVVPKTLIHMWKHEVSKHFCPENAMNTVIYYGKDRASQLSNLKADDLVITTYSIVRLDWKAKNLHTHHKQNLFSLRWRRLVLDEAHVIREPSKSLARSVGDLDAERRWAVTGTPIQNRLLDLFSLFKFLRCHPFDDRDIFHIHVTQSWRRHDPASIAKLKALVNCLSLRRPKSTIDLPTSSTEDRYLELTHQEQLEYERIRANTKASLDLIDPSKNSLGLVNTLQWINELRLMCSHGRRDFKETMQLPPWIQAVAQRRFDQLEQAGLARCASCQQDLSSVASTDDDSSHDEDPWLAESLDLLCSACYKPSPKDGERRMRICNRIPRHLKQTDELTGNKALTNQSASLPTKLRVLIEDLKGTPTGIKSVVFSSWTRTFDILQPRLLDNSIRSVRLDGSLSSTGRANVLRVFQSNPGIRVLLATITCGGVGVDLTAASRAYIVEPQWNPMSEIQALDRVYRLGQTKEVTTVKYRMRNTFEEQVVELQGKKRDLADITVNDRKLSREELSADRLAWLKELVG